MKETRLRNLIESFGVIEISLMEHISAKVIVFILEIFPNTSGFLLCDAEGRTAWKVSKYGPEKTHYLDTFHAVPIIKVSCSLVAPIWPCFSWKFLSHKPGKGETFYIVTAFVLKLNGSSEIQKSQLLLFQYERSHVLFKFANLIGCSIFVLLEKF